MASVSEHQSRAPSVLLNRQPQQELLSNPDQPGRHPPRKEPSQFTSTVNPLWGDELQDGQGHYPELGPRDTTRRGPEMSGSETLQPIRESTSTPQPRNHTMFTNAHNQSRNAPNQNLDHTYYFNTSNRTKPNSKTNGDAAKSGTQANIEEIDDFSDEEEIPTIELAMLKTLAGNSVEDWLQCHSRTIRHTLSDTASHTLQLAKNAMVCYFTNRPPYLQDFRD